VRNATLLKEIFDEERIPMASLLDMKESEIAKQAARDLALDVERRCSALLDEWDKRQSAMMARLRARAEALKEYTAKIKASRSKAEVRIESHWSRRLICLSASDDAFHGLGAEDVSPARTGEGAGAEVGGDCPGFQLYAR